MKKKIPLIILAIIIITSIIAVLIGFASTYFIKLVKPEDGAKIEAH